MNYIEIVLRGYFDSNSRKFLDRYFSREFKKAEKEHFEIDEFFEGCRGVILEWEDEIYSKAGKRPDILYRMQLAADSYRSLRAARAGELFLPDYDAKGTPKAQLRKKTIEHYEKDLKDLLPNEIDFHEFTADIPFRGGPTVTLKEVLIIEDAIVKAYQEIKNIKETLPPEQPETENDHKVAKPAVKKPESFNDMFEDPELIQGCIDILKKVNPPIITNKNHFNLGPRSKGAITAWVKALREKGLIKDNLKDNVIAQLINSKISGLNLGQDGRTLRNLRTTAYIKYYKSILFHLQDLPLST